MEHVLHQSIEDMTRPEALAALVSRPLQKVRLEPCQPVGWSSTESQFIAVKVGDEDYPPHVLKRMVRKRNRVMQVTEDQLGQRFDDAWWQPMLELSLLSAVLMIGCFRAWSVARASDEADRAQQLANLRWWAEHARAGAKWLMSDAT
jgi:hypothetical protein